VAPGAQTASVNTAGLLVVVAAFAALAACDSVRKAPAPDLLKNEKRQMERAKAVEQTLDDTAKKRMEEADRQEK